MINDLGPETRDLRPKVLITGAKGQLGLKLKEILSPDFELVLTDSDDMDITDIEKVDEVIGWEKPDFIIHAAAYTQVDKAEEDKELCMKINARGTNNVAEIAEKYSATLLYISTDFVFDGQSKVPYTEDDEPNPLSVYGESKYIGEQYVASLCKKYYILRAAWLFGELPEGHPGTNFVETMFRLASERDFLTVVSDQIGSPTYTGDLVKVIHEIIRSQDFGSGTQGTSNPKSQTLSPIPYGVYHFSGEGECSWYDFAKEIFKQSKIEIDLKPIKSDEYPQKAKRPPYSYLNKSKIKSALKMEVRPWQEMLREYLNKRK